MSASPDAPRLSVQSLNCQANQASRTGRGNGGEHLPSGGGVPPGSKIRSVLAIIQGRGGDKEVLDWACTLTRVRSAELTVLRLWSPPALVYWAGAGLGGYSVPELINECECEASEHLRHAVSRFPRDLPCTLICDRGRAGSSIVREALAGEHDCLVAARSAVGWWSRARLKRLRPASRIFLVRAGESPAFAPAQDGATGTWPPLGA